MVGNLKSSFVVFQNVDNIFTYTNYKHKRMLLYHCLLSLSLHYAYGTYYGIQMWHMQNRYPKTQQCSEEEFFKKNRITSTFEYYYGLEKGELGFVKIQKQWCGQWMNFHAFPSFLGNWNIFQFACVFTFKQQHHIQYSMNINVDCISFQKMLYNIVQCTIFVFEPF